MTENAIAKRSESGFDLMQREARLFSQSPLIPEHLRKGPPEQAIANCYIALKMAKTMNEDPLVVLQNIHVVHGRAGFASQYMIARANASGAFKGRLNWEIDRSDPKNLAVTCWAIERETEERVEFRVDMEMARAENWTKNSKYKTMPEVMLRYRSAAFLVRFYAPDVMLGYHTSEEHEDMKFARVPDDDSKPLSSALIIQQAEGVEVEPEEVEVEPEEVEVVPEPEPEPKEDPDPAVNDEVEAEEEKSPAEAYLDRIRLALRMAKEKSDVDAVDKDWIKNRAAYDDDVAEKVDKAIAAKAKRLRAA